MTQTVESPPLDGLDGGVIEDARARQRRHRGIAVAATAALAGIVTIVLAFIGGGNSSGRAGGSAHAGNPASPDGHGSSSGDFARGLLALAFAPIAGQDVWAANGLAIDRSNDGDRWTNITPANLVGDDPGARIAGFTSLGPRDLWLAATEAGDAMTNGLRGFAIERSTDGGRTWHWAGIAGCDAVAGAHASSGCSTTSLSFISPRRGWALGSNGDLYMTIDAGARWSFVTKAPVAAAAASEAVDFTAQTTAWLTAGPWLYRSRDGGQHWRRDTLPQAGRTGAHPALLGVPHFFDASIGVIPAVLSNGRTVIYRTSDGGRHWTSESVPVSPEVGPPARWSPPALTVSSDEVWSMQRGLLVTANAGRSWMTIPPPPTYADATPIWQFAMATATTGWILAAAAPCGSGPARINCGVPIMLRTTDAGSEWHVVPRLA
jgi:photosystem II stability/assembly factor-like uncharacterized protein